MSQQLFSSGPAKDAAYSNMYGARISGVDAITNKSVENSLTIGAATITSVTASSINGSSVNIALANCSPNELLATDANTSFVSFPYGTDATANSVPKRTAADFTAFSTLFLTDTSNQITANASPNQVIVTAPTPSSSRIYSLHFEGTGSPTQALTVTSSATGVIAFLDPSIVTTQIALKSASSGTAQFKLNSFTGFDSFVEYGAGGALIWSLGNGQSDDNFLFKCDDTGQQYLRIGTTIVGPFTVIGDVAPVVQGTTLGATASANRWSALGLAQTVNTNVNIVTFTGSNIAPGNFVSSNIANTTCLSTSVVLAMITNFTGTYFAVGSGCPYMLVTGVINGQFTLNLYNLDSANTIGAGQTTTVMYWIFS